jgi:hypothetical protein
VSRKNKKPKRTKEYYMQRKKFFSSCTDAFGVMSVIAFVMILTGTFDRLFPFGVRGLYSIFALDTLCIIAKWTYYKKAVNARKESKRELNDSSEG